RSSSCAACRRAGDPARTARPRPPAPARASGARRPAPRCHRPQPRSACRQVSTPPPTKNPSTVAIMTQEKVAVITGAAQGIGRRVAEVLAADGFALALFDRQPVRGLDGLSVVGDV